MPDSRRKIVVAVCTYHRNEPLRTLLDAVIVAADAVRDDAQIGVVIVDDDAEGKARPVVDGYEGVFPLGIHYRISGKQNISLARNIAIETAAPLGEWIAMTDDDCEVSEQWFVAFLDLLERTGADAATGCHLRRAPASAPQWLRDHPFLESGPIVIREDGSVPDYGQTNNSIIRSRFLLDRDLGQVLEAAVVIGLGLRGRVPEALLFIVGLDERDAGAAHV